MVSAVKVFKKTAPNGKITVYLGRRDFVDNTQTTTPVDGVVLVDNDYLRGRKVFGTVTVTYRFGREEDEMMGLSFSKELQLTCTQIYPSKEDLAPTEMQDRLLKKLGGNAYPFAIQLPQTAPCSIQLQAESAKPLGVIYEFKVFVAEHNDEKPHRRNSVTLAVRKVQYSPVDRTKRQPSTLISKGFTLSSGKMNLEVTLDKEIFYHGEQIVANINVNNGSKKNCKNIKCSIIQHVEVTMNNTHFTREVASVESKEGCPITPGSTLQKSFQLHPVMATNKTKGGVALDGKTKDSDANLASSTLVGVGENPNDACGIIVSYSFRAKVDCGTLGGEVVADLPFKLMHPAPEGCEKVTTSTEDNIVFEDFTQLRRGMSVDQI